MRTGLSERIVAPRWLALALAIVLSAYFGWPAHALRFNESAARAHALARYGAQGERTVQAWLAMLDAQRGQELARQLRNVNDFWNRTVVASEDKAIWELEDFWATPLETLGKRLGDCEDFVIGKYFSLVMSGVPPDKLRLIYVRARIGGWADEQGIAHMVLGYYETPHSDPLVLDNLVDSIMPAGQRKDLIPVFSFNAQGIYVGGARSAPVEQITRWRRLLLRMRQEGFMP
ncbi:MAG: transglutaminase-like cysteine peptidase [Candidimonas sp.]|jgi:predicted transglutaminase-like cysteine proteinase